MMGNQPIIVLREGTESTKGKTAQSNNIMAARAVADAVRSTLGPKGMDKMLVDSMGDIVITNDGATILKELDIEHPAAKMVVEISKTQDNECGDGTTSAVVIAGELLKKSEALIEQNVHPTVIANGFRLASLEAIKILKGIGIKVSPTDKKTLKLVAMTAMTGKSVGGERDKLADISVEAVSSVSEKSNGKYEADIDNIQVEKKHGGAVSDTKLIKGIVLDKERVHPRMPKSVKNVKIALIDSALEIKKTEVEAKIQIRDPMQMQKFLDEEENTIKEMVQKVKKSGATVIICEKGIDDMAQHYLAKDGIYAVRRVKRSDMEKLAKATGGKIVTNLDDLTSAELGAAETVEEVKIADSDMTFVTGCKNPKAVSILIRGGTEHVIDEVERALHDALKVVAVALEDGIVVPGGGAPEIEIAIKLRDYGQSVGGREQLAIEAFADAMEVIPWTLAENAGMDSINVLIELKNAHTKKAGRAFGVNVDENKVSDMIRANVIEPLRVKTQAVQSATEVASMVLRIDDVIAARKLSPSERGPPGGGMGGMGGMPGMM
ncbi:MAG: TCP-1/cpn60 chaperonin family protein [Thermoplasmata archaeon]|nr:TCP-1/cpn60 chaperonin family protein [Thermoplasmata archaeon]MCJ7561599.1 TCP-1/cpn60 chaperonin family protein [Thermoplasmata archaeon]TFG70286.1 MAG: thermosome subunit [Methanomassiliicoccus sp.]